MDEQVRTIMDAAIAAQAAKRTDEPVEVPVLSVAMSADLEPAWRWLAESWTLPFPAKSKVATYLEVLLGAKVT